MIVVWIIKWHSVPTLTEPLHLSTILGVTVAGGGTFIFMIASHIAKQSARGNAILHGSAHWANEEEVRRAGLLDNADGVYVGAWKDKRGKIHYLRDSGPAHVLCFAPTRSGKGVGLVLPTLLSWQHSCIVADLKGELWELTAGWRQEHAKNIVIRFEPGNPNGSAKWNPFDEIRVGTEYEFADVSDLSRIIVDPAGKGLEDHWARTANDLLTGCIMHLLYKRKCEGTEKSPANLTALDRMLANPDKPVAALFEEMKTYPHHGKSGDKPLVHPVVGSSAQKIMDKPDNERGSVISTAQSFLELYRDPTTAKNTASSDFSIADLMNYVSPVSLYLITTPDNKDRLCPLLRIFINWFLTKSTTREALQFTDGRTAMSAKHRLLMMMDEFPSFGKLPQIASGLAFIGGYGIKAYLITQDLSQLYERYGKDESITSNCHVQVAFPPNRFETAKYLSDMLGTTTVKEEHYQTSGKRIAIFNDSVNKSINLTQRPLLTPDETMTPPGAKKNQAGDIVEAGDMVVKVAGFAPIYGKQPLYFQDRIFLARAKLPAPKETDKIEKIDEEKADKNDEKVGNEASEVSEESKANAPASTLNI
ncbi:conjugal transfer protein TraG [Planctomycetales bacterium]|nr:conjugal transfer protein TraG [Planctomycetales bacterium]GHS99083.1 conjugal transfer protein TraG [Planctomycetales bacterium]GHT03662.1 conjugal transfer protein TraG [Planctomycetales bacterium]